jgi:hypothetical protein
MFWDGRLLGWALTVSFDRWERGRVRLLSNKVLNVRPRWWSAHIFGLHFFLQEPKVKT